MAHWADISKFGEIILLLVVVIVAAIYGGIYMFDQIFFRRRR